MRYRGGLPAVSSGVVPLIAPFKSLRSVLPDRGRAAIGRDYADVPPLWHDEGKSGHSAASSRASESIGSGASPPDEEFAADEEWCQFLDETQQSSRERLSNSNSESSREFL
jgi:hypothetical protein